MWEDFNRFVRNPLGNEHEVSYDTTSDALPAIAMSRPFFAVSRFGLPDTAVFLFSTPLLTAALEDERRLTLLHECIHMAFAFGEHRDRWARIQTRVRDTESEILNMPITTSVDLLTYLEYRKNVAFLLMKLPDEIVAEQRLKRDYSEWFRRRAEYYVRMRQGREAEIAAGRPGDVLWPFSVFYELLRILFFLPLVEGIPDLEEELQRLSAQTEQRFRALTPADSREFLLSVKAPLLEVALDRPLTGPEQAYDRLVGRIMATEPPAPSSAAGTATAE